MVNPEQIRSTKWVITLAEPHIDHCNSFEANQIEALIVDLSAAVNEGSDVKTLGLQVNLESDFLPMGIAHSAPAEGTDHLFKHLDGSTGEDGGSGVKTCQQTLRHSIATLTFASRINLIRRNLSRADQNDFNQ